MHAAGRPSLGSYEQNPRYELLLPEPATILYVQLEVQRHIIHAPPD
jgi:hypothetical protein